MQWCNGARSDHPKNCVAIRAENVSMLVLQESDHGLASGRAAVLTARPVRSLAERTLSERHLTAIACRSCALALRDLRLVLPPSAGRAQPSAALLVPARCHGQRHVVGE
jgi:hypothetical protein